MDEMKVLLLVGSPSKEHSTSNSIGQYLVSNLRKHNYTDRTICIYDALKTDAGCKEMTGFFNESDVIILSYPLYVDSLPANCIKALEQITEERRKISCNRKQTFVAVGNCGFYEKKQIENSLNVCRFFAKENNLHWQGGIAVGGGPQLQGKELVSMGGITKGLRQGLDMVSDSILKGTDAPMNKVNELTNPPEPEFLYRMIANWGFKQGAKKNGTLKNINDKPYVVR